MAYISDQELSRITKSLKEAAEIKRRNQELIDKLGPAIVGALEPAIKGALKDITINPEIKVPDIHMPEPVVNVSVPEIKVPTPEVTVNVPEQPTPNVKVQMPVKGIINEIKDLKKAVMSSQETVNKAQSTQQEAWARDLQDLKHTPNRPMPVMMVNSLGKPWEPLVGAHGAVAQMLQFKDNDGKYRNVSEEFPLPVDGSVTSLEVKQVSGLTDSVNVVDAFGSTAVNSVFNADNRIRVSVETGGSGLTDAELRASSVPIIQVSGNTDSVNVTTFNGNAPAQGVSDTAAGTLRVVHVADVVQSVNIVSGSSAGTEYADGTKDATPVGALAMGYDGEESEFALRTHSGVTGSGVLRVVHVNDVGVSVTATQTGTWNIGTVTTVTGITNTTAVVGDIASDVADTESNPVKIGGVARTANPTAVAAGDRISFTADDLGRQVMRPMQVRDLVKTAYVSVTNGTETTLLAGVAGSFLDCIAIMASNASDAAVSVDVRAVTAGNVVHTIRVPANGTAGWAPQIPWPQDATGNNWTVDGPDETGRTLTFSALFSQEV